MTLSDSEKISLISQIISDFWEFSEPEQIEKSALGVVNAIYSVVEFDAKSAKQ